MREVYKKEDVKGGEINEDNLTRDRTIMIVKNRR